MGKGEEADYLHGGLDVSSLQVVGITGLSNQTSSNIIGEDIGLPRVVGNGVGGSVKGSLFVGLVADHTGGRFLDGLVHPFGVAGANVDAFHECGFGFVSDRGVDGVGVGGGAGRHTTARLVLNTTSGIAVILVTNFASGVALVILVVQRLGGSGAGKAGTVGALNALSVGALSVGTLSVGSGGRSNVTASSDTSSS